MSTLSTKGLLLRATLLCLLAQAATGCGPQFDPPSKLQSLRILAVKKDDPYLRPTAVRPAAESTADTYAPDNTAHLAAAISDSRRESDKQESLQKLWFAGCNNPPRDNYFSCLVSVWLAFKAFTELGPGTLAEGTTWSIADVGPSSLTKLPEFIEEVFPGYEVTGTEAKDPSGKPVDLAPLYEQAAALQIGAGKTFDYTVPAKIIEQHPLPSDADLPRYGLSQVFLAVCDGRIGLSPDWQTNVDPFAVLTDATRGFPLTCFEGDTKKERGPDNFMVSYSNLYVYEELSNKNPVIEGFEFDGKAVPAEAVCIGESCLTAPPEPDCNTASGFLEVELCDPDSPSGCREYDITPVLSRTENSELDDIASRVGGGDAQLLEQMWIRYYADRGEVVRDTKRLQDATAGWFDEHGTKWTVPSEGEGPAQIWSVVYDNRGGVDWARVTVCLRK